VLDILVRDALRYTDQACPLVNHTTSILVSCLTHSVFLNVVLICYRILLRNHRNVEIDELF
jgi:hypothetical protein